MMSSVPFMNTLLNLTMAPRVVQASSGLSAGGEYKALVCLFLRGGNDSFNTLVPTTPSEYEDYLTARTNLAIGHGVDNGVSELLPLNGDVGGRTFGLHPSMPRLAALYNSGKAAFVANVGTLVEPIPSVDSLQTGTFRVPVSLEAHNIQQEQWETCVPQENAWSSGWFGRAADVLNLFGSDSPPLAA